ncbi:MAG: hypothetical protein RIS47_1749, partial [Bacteroidota bacterium]
LLGSRHYLPFEDGLLFYHENLQKYVIATFQPEVEYTQEQFYELPEEIPYQLINGKFVQTMGASIQHQRVSSKLHTFLNIFVMEHNLGDVLHSPTDIVLGENNIFQPDILYISVARQSQMQQNRIVGAPEFVVEILSKGTEERDRNIKMTQYGAYDVVEYWIVNPNEAFIEVYYNESKNLQLVQTAKPGDIIRSKAIVGFELEVARVF